ncbi:MAG: UDP-3-O-(3-hydroxymyristoyl)glucosamine N-acyltransferase [Candidatus Muiribacterium halophilum]|uniref:UDP-3-O-acylglucosamine N-acyltransferase n=1 Tax=Muiribacterium halophilum TaxID=2053465 RepID=A0A2N5ZJ69_MUIH1|nr:MAG: UDP-3-O-(3-hydroxymyristoyl)glucosamine N-acyltransferase [Candidatus Muirbacterium halophilum]
MKKIPLKDVIDVIEANLITNNDVDVDKAYITGINTLEEAIKGDVTFLGSKKYSDQVKDSKADFIIINEELFDRVKMLKDKKFLIVKNPYFAFSSLLSEFSTRPVKTGIAKTAFIEDSARIGKNVSLGHNVYVGKNVVVGDNTAIYSGTVIEDHCFIGENCKIYQNVVIRYDSKIGDGVHIQPGTVIGSDGFGYVQNGGMIHKIEQIGNVVIGDNVELGANVTIDRASVGSTSIGNGTKVDNLVHIAHSVKIGKNCFIVAQVGISGSVEIGDNVTIAGQSGIVGHLKIGSNSTIAARSVVMNNIKENSFVSGFPAVSHLEDMKLKAHIRRLPMVFKKLKKIIDFNEKN